MAWSGSGLFTATIRDILDATAVIDLDGATFKVALFNNSVTPDFDVASANTAYGAGVWASNEVTGTNWAAGGVALAGNDVTAASPAAGQVKWDATDVSEALVTVADAHGCLIYADSVTTPVADQGLIAVYFGGAYSATNGTFAITWHANGIFYIDLVP